MRRFVVIGQKASGSPDFSLLDLPATSGRLDVLLRCLRAALLVSHGVRRDTTAYLVLLGDEAAPRVLRVDGAAVRFLRPDERSLATLVQKALAAAREGAGFVSVRPGIAVAEGGLETVLGDIGPASLYVLEEGAANLRGATLDVGDPVFFVGDHAGFDEPTRARLASLGALPVSVGPLSLHADDIVAVVNNELDCRRPPSVVASDG
jgi:tRNA (pseudouridine54-N1)-methyltransferase